MCRGRQQQLYVGVQYVFFFQSIVLVEVQQGECFPLKAKRGELSSMQPESLLPEFHDSATHRTCFRTDRTVILLLYCVVSATAAAATLVQESLLEINHRTIIRDEPNVSYQKLLYVLNSGKKKLRANILKVQREHKEFGPIL